MILTLLLSAAVAAAVPSNLSAPPPGHGHDSPTPAGGITPPPENVPSLLAEAKAGSTAKFSTIYKPYKVEHMPQDAAQPGRKKLRFMFGPLELKPASFKRPPGPGKMDPNSDQFMGVATGIPTGVLVLSTNSSLIYEDGSIADVVNGVYNHHLIFADSKRNGPTPFKCPDGGSTVPDMGLLMGASEANRDLMFASSNKIKTGFRLDKDDPIMLSAELVNYTNDTKKVYSLTDFEYLETQPSDALHVSMQVFDVSDCNSSHKDASAPPGAMKWSVESKKAQFTSPGYILYRRGHMHDGGEDVEILVNGKQICDSKAIYGGVAATTTIDGKQWATISKMGSCTDPVKVEAGDSLQIIAHFDLNKHPARKQSHGEGMGEEMGLITFMFAPTTKTAR